MHQWNPEFAKSTITWPYFEIYRLYQELYENFTMESRPFLPLKKQQQQIIQFILNPYF